MHYNAVVTRARMGQQHAAEGPAGAAMDAFIDPYTLFLYSTYNNIFMAAFICTQQKEAIRWRWSASIRCSACNDRRERCHFTLTKFWTKKRERGEPFYAALIIITSKTRRLPSSPPLESSSVIRFDSVPRLSKIKHDQIRYINIYTAVGLKGRLLGI